MVVCGMGEWVWLNKTLLFCFILINVDGSWLLENCTGRAVKYLPEALKLTRTCPSSTWCSIIPGRVRNTMTATTEKRGIQNVWRLTAESAIETTITWIRLTAQCCGESRGSEHGGRNSGWNLGRTATRYHTYSRKGSVTTTQNNRLCGPNRFQNIVYNIKCRCVYVRTLIIKIYAYVLPTYLLLTTRCSRYVFCTRRRRLLVS